MYITKGSRFWYCEDNLDGLRAIALSSSSILSTQMLHCGDTLMWYSGGPLVDTDDLAVMNSTRPLVDGDSLVRMPLGLVCTRRLIRNLLSMAAMEKKGFFWMLRWFFLANGYSCLAVPMGFPQ